MTFYKKSSRTIRSPRRRGDPAGIRTPDTLLKRQVLCLLSYWVILKSMYLVPLVSRSKPVVLNEKERASEVEALPSHAGRSRNRQRRSDVAGMAGLEPTISESKSGVLPLHYIPPST